MLAIAGGKGGCGKTTTALALGRAFARQRRRPLVVDADADMPNVHILADAPADPGVDAVAGGWPARLAVHGSDRIDGVDVLGATPGAPVADALAAVASLDDRDRPVLLDCPGGASPDAAAPLRAADRALVATTPDSPAVTDALKTEAMARELGTPVAGVVVTRADAPPDRLARAFDAPILGTVPDAPGAPLDDGDVRVAYERLAHGVPRRTVKRSEPLRGLDG